MPRTRGATPARPGASGFLRSGAWRLPLSARVRPTARRPGSPPPRPGDPVEVSYGGFYISQAGLRGISPRGGHVRHDAGPFEGPFIFEEWETDMKQGIHPEYGPATIICSCGNRIETRSTQDEIHVEICSVCHPFYTGKQKLVDTAGRVERFERKYGSSRGEATDEGPGEEAEAEATEQEEVAAEAEA